MNISMILSGGTGERFQNAVPKQYQPLLQQEVIGYVIDALRQSADTDRIVIVAAGGDMERLQAAYGTDCAEAGDTHNASVQSGLAYIQSRYATCTKVLFVDAARPFLAAKTVDHYFRMLDEYDAAITTRHITDSLGSFGATFTDRSEYYLIQKPEAFRFEMLTQCFQPEAPKTAIVQHLPDDARIYRYFGVKQNLKITYPEDLLLAEYLMPGYLEEVNAEK